MHQRLRTLSLVIPMIVGLAWVVLSTDGYDTLLHSDQSAAAAPLQVVHEPASAHRDPNPRIDALSRQMQELRQVVNQLQAEQTRVSALSALPVAAEPNATTQSAAMATDSAETIPQGSEQQALADAAERANTMELQMSQQEPDPQWENQASAQITERLASAAAQSTVLDNVSCRGRMCRIELSYDSPEALDALTMGEALVAAPHQGFLHQIDESRSVFYLSAQD